ncbi:MAG: LamB/YcsF family protein [Acidimicrobiales bacterium]
MIDLNSDLGEGSGAYRLGDDEQILGVVSSANVACGFHGGDPQVMARTVRTAAGRGVVLGAHVSYPDRAGFGRRDLDVAPDDLVADVVYQIGALAGIARIAGSRVRYVKPHGALYNRIAVDEVQARAVVEGIAAYDRSLALLTLPGSVAMRLADAAGVPTVAECFADRAYTSDGRLVPRREPGAVIDDEAAVVARAIQMATDGTVRSVDGRTVRVGARSICLHSDTPGAGRLAGRIRAGLEGAGVVVAPFVDRLA